MEYYDGARLLSMQDANGQKPEIYIVTGNRTGGKTTFFSRMLVNHFLKTEKKFVLLYRYAYELDGVADKFFKDIGTLFFPTWTMTSIARSKGLYHELYLKNMGQKETKHCGYAICLNSADQLKRFSHFFSDTSEIFFDEFQAESDKYCPREVEKFMSIHTTIARGQGKMVRYVPVYMCSNAVSLINPYFVSLGISDRLRKDTKFLRGDGFVLEAAFVPQAAEAQKTSGFNKAFSKEKYLDFSAEMVYLNDNESFIQKMEGRSRYMGTIKADGVEYGVRDFPEQGIIYCSMSVDKTCPQRLALTTDDHEINYIMVRHNLLFINNCRYLFERGRFRFQNLQCKNVILKMLSVK